MCNLSKKISFGKKAIYALGNLAAKDPELRNDILKASALRPLLDIVEKSHNIQLVQGGTWALSKFIRTNPLPRFEEVMEAIPILSKIIQETHDSDTLVEAAWTLFRFSGLYVEQVLEANVSAGLVAQIKQALFKLFF